MLNSDLISNPTVFLGWFEWREPVTTLTDMCVSLVCIYAVYLFAKYKGQRSNNYYFYRMYFLCFAIGMMSAAWMGHGLVAYFGPEWKVIGWGMSILGYFFLGTASLIEIKPISRGSLFILIKSLFYFQIVAFLFLIITPYTSGFKVAQFAAVTSLIGFILPMHIFNYSKTKKTGSLLIFISFLCGILPAIVYNTQFSFSKWFNYHDISHVLVAINMYITLQGAKRLSMISNH